MSEVADGNSVTMSATEDISFQDRPEGFVSSRLSPCSKASLGGIVSDSINNAIDPNIEFDVGSSEKISSLSNTLPGGAIPGHGEVTRSAERWNASIGAGDLKDSPGSPQRDLQVMNDCCIEKAVSSTRKAKVLEDLHALEISALKTSAAELPIAATAAVGIFSCDGLSMETPFLTISAPATCVTEACTVETHGMEVTVRANFDEAAVHLGESIPSRNVVEDGFVGELESLPCSLKNEGLNIASESTTVKELPLTRNEDAGHQFCDGIYVKQNGEALTDEAVSATNCSISLHPPGATVADINEVVNSTSGHTIGRNLLHTSEKFTEGLGDKPAAPIVDIMSNKFADVVAGRMADAIADEIADQIADRIADEMAGKMADEMADEIAGGIAHDIADKMAGEMVDERADRMADEMADRIADEMADKIADEMADKIADEMADKIADEMADKIADEMADGMADEVLNRAFVRSDGVLEKEKMDGESFDIVDLEEQIVEDANKAMDDDYYEDDEGTPEEQMSFVEELEQLFKHRNLEYKAPKFYGLELNVLKLWRVVSRYGGYDHVTVSKLWRTVGEEFKPPKTCTTISWSFRGFYEKALLDYERFKTGVSAPDCSQGRVQIPSHLMNEQQTTSPATPSSEPSMGGPPGSGSGRARRDAAARAMQGWHSQRMGNGDSKEPNSKDKGSGGKYAKKEKKLTNIGGNGLKRKGSNTVLERAVKAVQARGRPRVPEDNLPSNSAVTGKRSMKQQDSGRRPMKVAKVDEPGGGFDPPIVDEGPRADWVKINIHKHLDCYEIYALVPGLAREEVRIQCEPGGRLVIAGMPEDPDNPWGVTPFRKVISLPSRIDAHQTSAVVTLYGQLYVRVPIAEAKSL